MNATLKASRLGDSNTIIGVIHFPVYHWEVSRDRERERERGTVPLVLLYMRISSRRLAWRNARNSSNKGEKNSHSIPFHTHTMRVKQWRLHGADWRLMGGLEEDDQSGEFQGDNTTNRESQLALMLKEGEKKESWIISQVTLIQSAFSWAQNWSSDINPISRSGLRIFLWWLTLTVRHKLELWNEINEVRCRRELIDILCRLIFAPRSDSSFVRSWPEGGRDLRVLGWVMKTLCNSGSCERGASVQEPSISLLMDTRRPSGNNPKPLSPWSTFVTL